MGARSNYKVYIKALKLCTNCTKDVPFMVLQAKVQICVLFSFLFSIHLHSEPKTSNHYTYVHTCGRQDWPWELYCASSKRGDQTIKPQSQKGTTSKNQIIYARLTIKDGKHTFTCFTMCLKKFENSCWTIFANSFRALHHFHSREKIPLHNDQTRSICINFYFKTFFTCPSSPNQKPNLCTLNAYRSVKMHFSTT